MRILIVTDAWPPQVNGVVRTITSVGRQLQKTGHDVRFVTPEGRKTWPMPFYPEILLSRATSAEIAIEIDGFGPDAIHIATEGPLGWAARRVCIRRGMPFTSSFHTRFAECISGKLPIPGLNRMIWKLLQIFHRHSKAVMASATTISRQLESYGFVNVKTWTRGIDHSVFTPRARDSFNLPRPILLVSGRVSSEKNIEALLNAKIRGTKVVVGDGPDRAMLAAKFPDAVFTGYLHEEDYANALSAADVFVFPSRVDTFGLVMIEAMACGTPVAAFDVASPVDVVERGVTGELDGNLASAIERALKLDRKGVHEAARKFTWERTAEMFESWLVRFDHAALGLPETGGEPLVHLR